MDQSADQTDDLKLAFPIATHLLSCSNSTDDFLSLTRIFSILVAPVQDVAHRRILAGVVEAAEEVSQEVVVVGFVRQATIEIDCLRRWLAILVHLTAELRFVTAADVLDVHNFESVPIDPKQFERLLFSRQYGSFHCFSADILVALEIFI